MPNADHTHYQQVLGFAYDGRQLRFRPDGTIDLDLEVLQVTRALGVASDDTTGCLLDLADHVAAHPDQADEANVAMCALQKAHVINVETYCDAIAASWRPGSVHVPAGCSWRHPWADLPAAAVDRLATGGHVNAYEHRNLSASVRAQAVRERAYTVHSNPSLTPIEYEELVTAAFGASQADTYTYRLLTNPAITTRAVEAVLACDERVTRTVLAINPALNAEQRARCQHDSDHRVRAASCWNPANHPDETAHLQHDPDPWVRGAEVDAATWRNKHPRSDPAWLYARDGYPIDLEGHIPVPTSVPIDPSDPAGEP
jgi:hypothetical protein